MVAMSDCLAIPEYYAKKSLFVTGATGFMGKVLVEKLPRSCPDLERIYLLIRQKKGKKVQERLDEIADCQLFDKLRTQTPGFKSKLVAMEGDMTEEGLGLDQSQVNMLVQEVTVVFHLAATVKFDEEIKLSAQMNVLGLKNMLELCHKLCKLESFVHISTAYANCDKDVIKEEIYPPPSQPQQLLSAVELMNRETLGILKSKMVGDHPNTYTYTKAVAESLIAEVGQNLPVAIFRPSIVGTTMQEPVPGWVDNVNGLTGMFIYVGKGLLRMIKGDHNATVDIIPVDLATNMLITVGWYTAVHKPKAINVYHCTTGQINRLTWGQGVTYLCKSLVKNPLENVARSPNVRFAKSVVWKNINVVFNNMLPAYLMDFYMWITGKRRMFVKIQDRLQKALGTLEYFTSKSWTFTPDNMLMVENAMTTNDRKTFPFNPNCINWSNFLENYCLGIKRYLLKEDVSQMSAARKGLRRLQKVHFMINATFFVVFCCILVNRVQVARDLWNMVLVWTIKLMQQKLPGFAKCT